MLPSRATLTVPDLGLDHLHEHPLHVLDLPQLYSKPPAQVILSILADLRSEPPSWEVTPRSGTSRSTSGASTPAALRRKIKSEGVPAYLTKIIASPLLWIDDEDNRERIWDIAAKRLSERSGRTAMGDLTRSFMIPTTVATLQASPNQVRAEGENDMWIDIVLHEPALSADSLGLKTWASSYLLAKRLVLLRSTLPKLPPYIPVLELGAGTGLVGLAAAAIFEHPVLLTDLPAIVPNLRRNIETNATTITQFHGRASAAILDWSDPASFHHPTTNTSAEPHSFPLILAADAVYSTEHPALLLNAIGYHLSRSHQARVVLEIPLRKTFAAERQDLQARLREIGLEVVEQGEEVGFDDWTNGAGENVDVRCWWSIWGWANRLHTW